MEGRSDLVRDSFFFDAPTQTLYVKMAGERGWHVGGMKCILGNVRCTVRDCEVAYNVHSDGIWFDCDNADIGKETIS